MPQEEINTYKYDVKMTCSGCSGAVSRVLEKAKNKSEVEEYNVDLAKQEVVVKSHMPYDDIMKMIQKTGKEVRSGVTIQPQIDAL